MTTETKWLESLNDLVIAMDEYLGEKYTVRHIPDEDGLNAHRDIAVIDNDTRVGAFLTLPRPFVAKSEGDLKSCVEILSRHALKTISKEMEKPA